ncbi:MAG: hypothetical protein WC378_20905 [Opitutaceae bacterium]
MTTIDTYARLLFLARYCSRRSAKRELREAGGKGTATELDAVLREIASSPNREQIEHLASELADAHAKAALAPRPEDTPLRQGCGHDEWIIGEGAESRRMYVIYLGRDTAFIGEVFDDEADVPPDLCRYDLDEGQVLANVVWLDELPSPREQADLFEIAREKLRAYDAMQDRDMEELDNGD